MKRSVFLLILAIAFFVALFIDTSYFNVSGAIVLLVMGILLPILFIFYKDDNNDIRRVYFRPVHLFLLSFVIVFFQMPVDILLGYHSGYYLVGRIDLMPESVRVSLLGLIAFFLGYIIKKEKDIQQERDVAYNMLSASTTVYKLLTSVMLVVIFIVVPKSVLFGGYSTSGVASSGYNYFASWCSVFYCAFFIQYSINLKLEGRGQGWTIMQFIKNIGWWQNINMAIFLLLILNLGDRGPLVYIVTIYYTIYLAVTGICPSKKTLIIGMVAGVVIAAFLGYSKSYRDNNTIFERINTTWEANPYEDVDESIIPATFELSKSYRCLPYSIEDIQRFGNYGYGKYQLTYLVATVPFASALFDLKYKTSTYISHLIQGDFLSYGNGTSVIADFYLDGGLIAVIICMFIFGYFVRKFDLVLFSNKKASILLYCCAFYMSMHFISIPRSMILMDLKYSVWLAVIIYLNQKYSNRGVIIKHKLIEE